MSNAMGDHMTEIREELQRRGDDMDYFDVLRTMTRQRRHMTRSRADPNQTALVSGQRDVDFLDFVSIACDIYQSYLGSLIPMQQFHRGWETEKDFGNTCIVTSRSILSPTRSLTDRTGKEMSTKTIIIKRTKKSLFGAQGSSLPTFVRELLVRSHPPLRSHPHIVDLRGIAWDFENDDEDRPRPLLVEELAPHGSLEVFWKAQNLVRMPFKVKAGLCRDIAEGLHALHECGVVHGDIKPGNILIFPATVHRGPLIAKLTDFGHSVCHFEGRRSLPAWTPWWCAPEADGEAISDPGTMTIHSMKATDVYSYGLVAACIIIGKSIFDNFGFPRFNEASFINGLKSADRMEAEVMCIVIHEDQTQLDSDFNLPVVQSILRHSLRKEPTQRTLSGCLETLTEYENSLLASQGAAYFSWQPVFVPGPIQAPPIAKPPLIGYRTISECSYLVKKKVVAELRKAATDNSDPRQPSCAWELCICYFCGFGVERDWTMSRLWLTRAAVLGLETAQAFFLRIHSAMHEEPLNSLHDTAIGESYTRKLEATGQSEALIGWADHAISSGCVEILTDVRRVFDETTRLSFYDSALATYRRRLAAGLRAPSVPLFKRSSISVEFLRAVIMGDLELVQQQLQFDPDLMACVDSDRNTAVILAAKAGNFAVLDYLIQQPISNVAMSNTYQQSVLHFLAIFEDNEIQNLVPRLVETGANLFLECQPVVNATNSIATFSLSIPCCPLLNAIIRNHMVLLETLLAHLHPSPCRVCEGGSRYRKILAVAVALHCDRAITILESHRFANEKEPKDLGQMEVWYQSQPISLRHVPFDGFALRGLDLPESFLRAIYHGHSHMQSLARTLDLLLNRNDQPVNKKALYHMIEQSVRHEALDALKHLQCLGFADIGDLLEFSLTSDMHKFHENPVFLSIRLGFRCIFNTLLGEENSEITYLRSSEKCWPSCSHLGKHSKHQINMTHLYISAAVTASHFDQYFITFLLQHCPEEMILELPSALDECLSGQPTAFMAQAIFTHAFRSVSLAVAKYPQLLDQRVPEMKRKHRNKHSISYTAFTDSAVLTTDAIGPMHAIRLSEFMLLVGSNTHCQFLHTLRRPAPQQCDGQGAGLVRHCTGIDLERQQTTAIQGGAGVSWRDQPLSKREFHWLMVGLIADTRQDRMALWELVEHQVALPQHSSAKADSYYVRLAVMYMNTDALVQLRDKGWAISNAPISISLSPLSLAALMRRCETAFPYSRQSSFRDYVVQFEGGFAKPKDPELKKTMETLQQMGCSVSSFNVWNGKITSSGLLFTLSFVLVLLHLLVLPLGIGFSPYEPRSSEVKGLKFVYLYGWSISCLYNIGGASIIIASRLLFWTPLACYSSRTFDIQVISRGYAFLFLYFVLVFGHYVGVPWFLYSGVLRDATNKALFLVGFMMMCFPVLAAIAGGVVGSLIWLMWFLTYLSPFKPLSVKTWLHIQAWDRQYYVEEWAWYGFIRRAHSHGVNSTERRVRGT